MTKLTPGMTKKELLAVAKEYNISGRHDMGMAALVEAIQTAEATAEPADEFITKEQLVSIKRRKPSGQLRDESGRVVRAGRNLSGNVPFRYKYYYLAVVANAEAVAAAPMQVQLILKFMRDQKITDTHRALRGSDIAGDAIAKGYLKTKIAPANLFAYYRRVLEALGVKEGVGPSDEEGEE